MGEFMSKYKLNNAHSMRHQVLYRKLRLILGNRKKSADLILGQEHALVHRHKRERGCHYYLGYRRHIKKRVRVEHSVLGATHNVA